PAALPPGPVAAGLIPLAGVLRVSVADVMVIPVSDVERPVRPHETLHRSEVSGTITAVEALELEDLQDQLRRYRRQVTALSLAETRPMLEELERKASQANP